MTGVSISAIGFGAGSSDGELESLRGELRHLAQIGADAAEIEVSSLDVVAGGRVIEDRVRRLVEITRSFPLRYTVHGLVCSNFMDPETLEMQLAVARAYVEICDRIDARMLVHHGGMLRANQQRERAGADAREREALAELADFAARYGVRIGLENIFSNAPGEYRQSPSQVAATVKAVGHPNLVALIDFSHAHIEAAYRGLDVRAEIAAMAPVAGHLHVHDSFGRTEGGTRVFFPSEAAALGLGDLHLPLGWGDIPWEEIFSSLTLLPDTILVMEIDTRRFRAELPACLERARHLAGLVNRQVAAA